MEPLDIELEEGELELPSEPMHLNMGPSHPGDARHRAHRARALGRDHPSRPTCRSATSTAASRRCASAGRGRRSSRTSTGSTTSRRCSTTWATRSRSRSSAASSVPERCQWYRMIARRARAHLRPPDVRRRDGDGARGVHPVPLVHEGARDHLRHPRGGDGRAPHALVRPHRRHGAARRPPGFKKHVPRRHAARSSRSSRRPRSSSSRTASSSTASRASGRSAQEDAIALSWTGPCLRSTRRRLRRPQGAPVPEIRRGRLRRPGRQEAATSSTASSSASTEIRQSRRIIDQSSSGWPTRAPSTSTTRASCSPRSTTVYTTIEGTIQHFKLIMEGREGPAGRGLLVHRGGQRRARLLPRLRRQRARRTACASGPPASPSPAASGKLITGRMLSDVIPTFGSLNMIGGECDH